MNRKRTNVDIILNSCPVCKSNNIEIFKPQSFFFPCFSESKTFKNHCNNICFDCGIIFLNPQPSDEKLSQHYNSSYRLSDYVINYNDTRIDLPVQFPESAHSFFRFNNFLKCLTNLKLKNKEINFNKNTKVLDLGGYQGMFLNAFSQIFNINGIVADLNENGINFAKKTFGFKDSFVIKSPENFSVKQKVNLVTMIHSLEHMRNPINILNNLRNNILTKDGHVFIEVPNLFGSPLNDPVHFFTFTKQSLSYILNKSGFELLDIFNCGNKHAPMTLNNDKLVIVCMARVSSHIKAQSNKKYKGLSQKVLKSYNSLSLNILRQQFNVCVRELAKLFYYIFGHYFLRIFFKDIRLGVKMFKKIFKIRLH